MTAEFNQNNNTPVFINRRKGTDRRLEHDRCQDMPMDLFHRKRRKTVDRRASDRSLLEDYMAYSETSDNDVSDNETLVNVRKHN